MSSSYGSAEHRHQLYTRFEALGGDMKEFSQLMHLIVHNAKLEGGSEALRSLAGQLEDRSSELLDQRFPWPVEEAE